MTTTLDTPKKNKITIIKDFKENFFPDFSISILCCNRIGLSVKCITNVLKSVCKDFSYELILSNNGSTDNTLNILLEKFESYPNIKIVQHSINQGFGEGHNYVLKNHVRGRYFILLNNDLIVDPHIWLLKFFEATNNNDQYKIFGPLPANLRTDGSGYRPNNFNTFDYIEGACLMIQTSFAKKIGLFDTVNYPYAYSEDAELSLRVRKMGYDIKLVPFETNHIRNTLTMDTIDTDVMGYNKKNNYTLMRQYSDYINTKSFEETIVLRRDAAIGDVFLVSPIARYFKEKNKYCKIILHTNKPILAKNNPNYDCIERAVDSKFTPSTQGIKYIDLNNAYESNPNKHLIDAYALQAGIKEPLVYRKPELYLETDDNCTFPDNYIVTHLGPTAWKGRNLPIETAKKVVHGLKELGYNIVEVGHQFNLGTDLAVNGTAMSWQRTNAYVKNSVAFFGIDSVVMHMAQSYIKPGVVCFGCVDPVTRLVFPNILVGVHADVGCKFCLQWQTAPRVVNKCVRNREYCMQNLKATEILEAFRKGMENKMYTSETQKIRPKILKYCNGSGVDIGCGHDKILPDAIGVDKLDNKGVDKILDCSKPLPFSDAAFDYVYSSHCLEDILDTETTLKEWLRILKPEGYIILYIPHKDLYKGCNLDHVQEFTPDNIKFYLEKFNTEIVFDETDDPKRDKDTYSFCIVGKKK